jgi:hypothetical protein
MEKKEVGPWNTRKCFEREAKEIDDIQAGQKFVFFDLLGGFVSIVLFTQKDY